MLNLIVGRAGSGKTAAVQNEIKRRMQAGEKDLLMIVPEQYSHDAEKQLCNVCGDSFSLHGDTLSFTRLAGRVLMEVGYAKQALNAGGQMLVMHRAVDSVCQKLQVFGDRGIRIELLESLISAALEFKSLRITADTLESLSKRASSALSPKLLDLALIFEAYDALLHVYGGDMSDMLTSLADAIAESSLGDSGHIYFDGFNDFTEQELAVIEELMRKNAEITVCLTYDISDDSEVFELPQKTAAKLTLLAKCYDTKMRLTKCEPVQDDKSGKSPELLLMEKHLFKHENISLQGDANAISIYKAGSRYEECEFAAFAIWELIQSGYRWRDIGVMARNWEQYGSICENIFENYMIDFFSSGKADVLDKPPTAHIDAALEIAISGWEYKPIFRYLKTGLSDISQEDCFELENYVLKWNIRGDMWHKDWKLPPYEGEHFEAENTDKNELEKIEKPFGAMQERALENENALRKLNSLRAKIVSPILRLRDGIKGVSPVSHKLKALYAFFEDSKLPEALMRKSDELEKRGNKRLSDEYSQLWKIILGAMEQMYSILGEYPLDTVEFRKMLSLILSGYDVGVIPVSLDAVNMGSMAMSRRRDLKCLIVLGATDENMPMLSASAGALSDNERKELAALAAMPSDDENNKSGTPKGIPSGLEDKLIREMNMLYSTVTQPSKKLILSYPDFAGSRPAYIVKRLLSMFSLSEMTKDAVGLTAFSEQFIKLKKRGAQGSGAALERALDIITADSASLLYGQRLTLSPSRVDKYYSCPLSHFLLNGLRLKPRVRAAFDAPMAGTFMHFVLEGVSREIKETSDFKSVDDEMCRRLVDKYAKLYAKTELFGFEGKNARFIYLFERLRTDAVRILSDMLCELKCSDFVPLDFEFDFKRIAGQSQELLKLHIKSSKEGASLALSGIVDRIDGWESGGKLFIRVIDYKTGKKSFSLSELICGRDMQMLIYLFALKRLGEIVFGADVYPAGMLYVPARDVIVKAQKTSSEEEVKKTKSKQLKRGGLILADPLVIDAMEFSGEKQYIPVKTSKDGQYTGDALVSPGQIDILERYVNKMLTDAAFSILNGEIKCKPYYANENDNACLYCEFHAVCTFDLEGGDKRRYACKLKADEVWELLGSVE